MNRPIAINESHSLMTGDASLYEFDQFFSRRFATRNPIAKSLRFLVARIQVFGNLGMALVEEVISLGHLSEIFVPSS